MPDKKFHTFKEDMDKPLTASMEDYIEMVYRLSKDSGYTRINDLSKSLNIKPSSATKMIQKLSDMDYLKYQKYGVIVLKSKGYNLGENLLNRHNTVEEFLKLLKVKDENILYETEKIEHTISDDTLKCIKSFLELIKKDEILYNKFINK